MKKRTKVGSVYQFTLYYINFSLRDTFCVQQAFYGERKEFKFDEHVNVFNNHMRNELNAAGIIDVTIVDMFFFPIIYEKYVYLFVFNMKKNKFVILDNQQHDENPKDCYGDQPWHMHNALAEYLNAVGFAHLKETIRAIESIGLKMAWRNHHNVVDCAIYTLKHMKTYNGGQYWTCGLTKNNMDALRILRIKFLCTLVSSKCNIFSDDVLAKVKLYQKNPFPKKHNSTDEEMSEVGDKKIYDNVTDNVVVDIEETVKDKVINNVDVVMDNEETVKDKVINDDDGVFDNDETAKDEVINDDDGVLDNDDTAKDKVINDDDVVLDKDQLKLITDTNTLTPLTEIHNWVADYVSYTRGKGTDLARELLVSVGDISLNRVEMATLRKSKYLTNDVIDCWSELLNANERRRTEPSEPFRFFFTTLVCLMLEGEVGTVDNF
ncbi:uncharacterized protein LOC141614173 [Silene latifolia]|uniref:uncharacterized protein LOC141614173 n=1 Tax=Silene latifolia TaxID=37657 RepID=UPI003D76BDF6